MDMKLTLNMAEAAELAGVSVPIMRQLANRKDFPAIRAGKRWVIPYDAFKRWLEDRANERAVI